MTYDFYTQCTCGQDGSNILDSVAELYKMQIDAMFLNILCSSFAEGCKNKAPTKKKIWSYLRVDKRGSHGDFCQMTGHDSWISEQSKHRNNRAAQAHQSRSNDCSVGIQRPCLRDGDRIWNDFVPLEWINYGLEGNMNQTYKMFAVQICLPKIEGFWAPKSWLTPHRCWKFAQHKNTTVQSWKHKYGISPKTSQNHEIQSFKWKLKNKPRTSKHNVMVVGVTTYLTTVWYALDFQCITISQFTHE